MSAHPDKVTIRPEDVTISDSSIWAKLPMYGGIAAVVGLGLAAVLSNGHMGHFWYAYLTAMMFAAAIGFGGLFYTIVHHLVRASWGIVLRRIAENLAMTLPVVGVLGLALVFFGAHDVWHWTHPGVVENDPMLAVKSSWLNEGAFRTRYVIYLVVWAALAYSFWNWSTKQDTSSNPEEYSHKARFLAAPALAGFALSLTFSAFDLMMGLDPHWFSTMFGVYYFAGIAVTIHAVLAVLVVGFHKSGYLKGIVTEEHFHDLGKFMFGFTVFWAYIGFSQYFLIWYADIPEETDWFSYRGHGTWLTLSFVLVFGRFVIPWLVLLRRPIKRMPGLLVFAALFIIGMEFVDLYWLIQPAHAHDQAVAAKAVGDMAGYEAFSTTVPFNHIDILALIGFMGVVAGVFGFVSKKHALVPIKDPRLAESVHFENF